MDDELTTAFLIQNLDGTSEELDKVLIGRMIHGALLCPLPDGGAEWAITMIPIGVVNAWAYGNGTLTITLDLLKGEVDRI